MAGKKGNTKAEHMAASEAALKGGRTWAQRFIELVRENPKNYALQGWIDDAESHFKGNPVELNDFYMTLQAACLGQHSPETNPTHQVSREALECHLAAIEDRISKTATVLVMATDYAQGESGSDDRIDFGAARMVVDAMEIADEQLAAATAAIAELKAEAGIKEVA